MVTTVYDSPTQRSSLSVFEKREELRRVLQSRQFASAPRRARFLEFVSEQTFVGNGEKLNEYLIGVEVYGRGTDFNPQRDPIVRVQAHEIRRSLRKYYEESGRESSVRIDLPAGHYIPVFTRPETPAQEPEATEAPEIPRPTRRLNWLVVGLSATCVVLALLLVLSLVRRGDTSSPEAAALDSYPAGLKWFWGPFLPPARSPLLVIPNHPVLRAAHNGDSEQTVAEGFDIPKTRLPEFRDTIHFRELKRFIFVPSLTDFTSVGETLGLVRMCRMFYRVGDECRVQPSRLVNFEEIRGNNAILLGGSQSWSGRVFLDEQDFQMQSGVILNRHPRAGEQPEYKPEFDAVTNHLTRDYALILMLPNQDRDKRVLLIYGIYTQGSEASIDYLLDPERMANLRKALMDLSADHKSIPPYFEALLATRVENGVPGTTSLVAVRRVTN